MLGRENAIRFYRTSAIQHREDHMNTPKQFACILSMCFVGIFTSVARADAPVVPDERDRQVLQTLLIHLLADPEFDMTRAPAKGAVIVLHARTPTKTGFLQSHQMRNDIGDHTLPGDAEQDLRQRNTPSDAKPDTYDAVAASFTDLKFGAGILVADLTPIWKQRRSLRAFENAHPKPRGWVEAYLPGYSKDGSLAVLRAFVGPWAHAATVTALLEKKGDKWIVKWHHIARYA